MVCSPIGQEYLRAHRCLRELASRLALAGFHTLRFDLFGSGDSAGELAEARLEGWVEDVLAAGAEAREASGGARVAYVGLRFGATLAAMAAGRDKAAAVVLWDAVKAGGPYLSGLEAEHASWLAEHAPGAVAEPGEAFGFSLGEALAREVRSLDLRTLAVPPAPKVLALTTDPAATAEPPWPWPPPGFESRTYPAAPVWRNAEGMEHALVPVPVIDAVVAWLREACP